MFLDLTKYSKSLTSECVEKARAECLQLLEKLTSQEVESLGGAVRLNEIVEEVNKSLAAPYPFFMTDTAVNFVKGEIVAFEHYLNQELKAKHLNAQQEAPLFNDSLRLWEQVGTSLSAREGVAGFGALIEKLNRMLPEEEHYPFLDENQF